MTATGASVNRRVLIFGADGLRPDLVSSDLMPTYARLIAQGTRFTAYNSAFPTHTRVNMSSLTTGTRPGTHGLIGNVMFVPGAGQGGLVDTSKDEELLDFERVSGEQLLLAPTLGDRLFDAGERLFVAASSSPGASLLWNLNHPYNVVNPGSNYAQADLMALHDKLGTPAPDEGRTRLESSRWAAQALIDLALGNRSIRAMTLWLTEPDASQHWHGLGSPQARRALQVVDDCLAQILAVAEQLGVSGELDILLVSDHGHSTVNASRSLSEHLAHARRELGLTLPFTCVGDALYLSQDDRDEGVAQLPPLVEWFLAKPWCDLIFASGEASELPGTVPLQLAVGELKHARAPILTVSPTWRHDVNEFGVPGGVDTLTSYAPLKSTHGTASPYDMRACCVGFGPSFGSGMVDDTPCGTTDIAPTVCDILGLSLDGFDGRSLLRPIDPEQVSRQRIATGANGAGIEVASVGNHRYFLGSSPEPPND